MPVMINSLFIEIYCTNIVYIYTGCAKKKDILNIHIKSEGISIFSKKFAGQSVPYLWSNIKSSHL